MSITGLIIIGIIATLILHFIGIFTKSLKLVWIVIIFLWAFGIDVFVSEIKPDGYKEIKKMQGKYKDTDELIKKSGKEVSFYELLEIKQSYLKHEREEE